MRRTPRSRPPSRPRLLTPEVEQALVAAVRAGAPMADAAVAAGIAPRTFENWRRRGHEELEARADGDEPDADEEDFVELYNKLIVAQAHARVRGVANIRRVAQGGFVTEETTKKYRDPGTGELVEETTVKRTPPDWRADAFLLERLHRSQFGKHQELEVTGAGGGPLAVTHTVDLTAMSERLAGILTRDDTAAPLPADELPALTHPGLVVPGDIVQQA